MLTVDANELGAFTQIAIEGVGAPSKTAETVARSLVDADLAGHTSHGLARVPYYADLVRDEVLDPAATPNVVDVGPFVQVVGGAAFGQLSGRRAVEELLGLTGRHGVGVVGIRDSGHLGRIGEWAQRVTSEGYLFVSWVNLQGGSQRIAPAGTADPRLGTNPLTFGVPSFDALPFDLVFDGATSQVAHGKIIEREGSGEQLPGAWTITDDGTPVELAADFQDGVGALLPLGGHAQGYKGFGLALMVELFASIVGDGPVSTEERQDWVGNGGAFLAIDPENFVDPSSIERRVRDLAAHVRSADPIDDDTVVLLPGESEYRTTRRYRRDGVPVRESLAETLREVAVDYEIEDSLPDPLR